MMSVQFDTSHSVEHNGINIFIHWKRYDFKQKTNICLFEEDDGTVTVEKDYISFDYAGVRVKNTYKTDEYAVDDRVKEICYLIDDGKLDELTAMNIEWEKIKK